MITDNIYKNATMVMKGIHDIVHMSTTIRGNNCIYIAYDHERQDQAEPPYNIMGYLQFIADYNIDDIAYIYKVQSQSSTEPVAFLVAIHNTTDEYFIGRINLPAGANMNNVPVYVFSKAMADSDGYIDWVADIAIDIIADIIPKSENVSMDIMHILARRWVLSTFLNDMLSDSRHKNHYERVAKLMYQYDRIRDEKYATVAVMLLHQSKDEDLLRFLKDPFGAVDYLFASSNIFNELMYLDGEGDIIQNKIREFDMTIRPKLTEEDDEPDEDNTTEDE